MMILILRMIRDAEEKLMADVEGWEVGTFYGHKVYKVSNRKRNSKYKKTNIFTLIPESLQTIGDQLPMMSFDEFYIHTNRAEINKAQAITRWLKMD